jgi:hypothetical protein
VQASNKAAQLQLLLNLRGSKQTPAPAAAARVQSSVTVQACLVMQLGLAQTGQQG